MYEVVLFFCRLTGDQLIVSAITGGSKIQEIKLKATRAQTVLICCISHESKMWGIDIWTLVSLSTWQQDTVELWVLPDAPLITELDKSKVGQMGWYLLLGRFYRGPIMPGCSTGSNPMGSWCTYLPHQWCFNGHKTGQAWCT